MQFEYFHGRVRRKTNESEQHRLISETLMDPSALVHKKSKNRNTHLLALGIPTAPSHKTRLNTYDSLRMVFINESNNENMPSKSTLALVQRIISINNENSLHRTFDEIFW